MEIVVSYFPSFRDFLSGKKTYIVATLLVLVGAVNLLAGDITFEMFLNDPSLWIILNGLGLGALRAGISKN